MYIIIKYCEKLINVLLFFYCFDRINIDNTAIILLSNIDGAKMLIYKI